MSGKGVFTSNTFANLVADRLDDQRTGLQFEGQSWTWQEVIAQSSRRGELARRLRRPGPWHVGVLLDNTPEFIFWILGCAAVGATLVGINPTRRGSELAADINFTDCQLIVTESALAPLLADIDLTCEQDRMLLTDTDGFAANLPSSEDALQRMRESTPVEPQSYFSLVFTSGTTGGPKAVICSQGRLADIAVGQCERRNLTSQDVIYIAMPLFHSNALMAGIAPAVLCGGTMVLRRKFSASGFLPDIRQYGVTFFHYVGKPLHYILATAEQPDDHQNSLRIAFGNEASDADLIEFARRFDCQAMDSYGTSEGGIRINRAPDGPPGSLGIASEGTVIMNSQTLIECPPAVFDEAGRLINSEAAIGEIVNLLTAAEFEGYYKNPQADADRVRNGWLWSGDLGYRDTAGYFYFAGRTDDWLRVDGENFAAAPVERLLLRYPPVSLVAVYAIPDPEVGDLVMAAIELHAGATFEAAEFADFLKGQKDLGTKWPPAYIRLIDHLPRTPTNKVIKKSLRAEGTATTDPLFFRPTREIEYTAVMPTTAP